MNWNFDQEPQEMTAGQLIGQTIGMIFGLVLYYGAWVFGTSLLLMLAYNVGVVPLTNGGIGEISYWNVFWIVMGVGLIHVIIKGYINRQARNKENQMYLEMLKQHEESAYDADDLLSMISKMTYDEDKEDE